MEAQERSESKKELAALCDTIRAFVGERKYRECEALIFDAMKKYPHAPEPHNLIGVLLEKQGDHLTAMKHFRAAWALDPTYLPARQNLDSFGTFFSRGQYALDESDCPEKAQDELIMKCDEHGVDRVVRRN